MSLSTQVTPEALGGAVLAAVADGAWAPCDIVATVTAQAQADRSDVIATLWDLVDAGVLEYHADFRHPVFRVALASAAA